MSTLNFIDDLDRKRTDAILDRSNAQPDLLENADEKFSTFLETMSMVWRIADEYNLSSDISFTNFLMFGPQSAGKTTIAERIMGFPLSVVKNGIGTTRPIVLTTRYASEEEFKVKSTAEEKFKVIQKYEIMEWVKQQMKGTGFISGRPRVTKDRIYIEVSGPEYMHRRFIDLPGFQCNDEGDSVGTRQDILDLLKKEMENPDTVVVCVEDVRQDFANSNLVMAMKEVFGREFLQRKDLMQRFILVLNKSDTWLSTNEVTKSTFMTHISSYVEGCGLVPILVGSSVDPKNGTLRAQRSDGHADFDAVVNEYLQANDREEDHSNNFFDSIDLNEDLKEVMSRKFWGFKTLLKTVDSMVVQRDVENAQLISQRLLDIGDDTSDKVQDLERKSSIIQGSNGANILDALKLVVKVLLKNLTQIATSDFGTTSAIAASGVREIKRHGNTAYTEELEFVFGGRNRYTTPPRRHGKHNIFKGYYDPDRIYITSESDALELSEETSEDWTHQIFSTVEDLNKPRRHMLGSISYLNTPLIGGALYDRAVAVWSSSVYRFLVPSPDDLIRLANTVGIDPEMSNPKLFDFKKVKRLAQIYAHRINPAVHYLCQKLEFLLHKNFDTAWRSLLRTRKHKMLLEAVGEKSLKAEFRRHFQHAIRKKAAIAYGKCFSDLQHEVHKLAPYSMDRPAVTGMLFAFSGIAEDMIKTKKKYHEAVKQEIRSIFPENFPTTVLVGIETGIDLLSEAGSIDPLLFSGLHIVKSVLGPSNSFPSKIKRSKINNPVIGAENLSEDRDERLLGLSACLYAHILPRFISTVDARLRMDLWATVKDENLIEELESFLSRSESVRQAKLRADECAKRAQFLTEKEAQIRTAYSQLVTVCDKLPNVPPPINSYENNEYANVEYNNYGDESDDEVDNDGDSFSEKDREDSTVVDEGKVANSTGSYDAVLSDDKTATESEDDGGIVFSSLSFPFNNQGTVANVVDFPGTGITQSLNRSETDSISSDIPENDRVTINSPSKIAKRKKAKKLRLSNLSKNKSKASEHQ